MSVRKAVVGVVYRKDDSKMLFLVLHRVWLWKGWEFPKGGIERAEFEENALLRELQEETGLTKIRIIEKLPYQIKYVYPKKYADKYKHSETAQSVYLVRAFEEEIRISKEHDRHKWLPYDEARKLLTHVQQKKALDVAWRHLKNMGKDDTVVTF